MTSQDSVTTRNGFAARNAWKLYILLGAGAVAWYFVAYPRIGAIGLYEPIGVCSGLAILLGTRINRPAHPAPWRLFAVGQIVISTGDIIWSLYDHYGSIPFPSIADVVYLTGYPLLVAGIYLLVKGRSPTRDKTRLIDATIIGAGVGLVCWIFLMAPYANDTTYSIIARLVSIAYPLADVVLLAFVAWLVMAPGARTASYRFLALALLLVFTADSVYGWQVLEGTYVSGAWLDGLYLCSYLAWGATALHPSMRSLSLPAADRRHGSTVRIPVLGAVCLLGPVAYGIQWWRGEPIHPIDVMIGSGVLFLLVLAKMSGLMKSVESTVDDLKTSEEKYRSIVETTNEWIWELDASLKHTYSNPAVERILGYRPEEIEAAEIMELIHPEDTPDAMEEVKAAMAAGTGWEGVILRWKHRDGSFRYLESSSVAIVDHAGATVGWRGADRDVTERVRADEERLALQDKLNESQKMEAIGRLAGGVAHDFNNLLTVIINNSIFLRSELVAGSEAAEDLDAVTDAAKRGADLVRQLLAFARKEAIHKEAVDLNDIVGGVGVLLARVGGENVHIETDLGDGLGPILADPGQIEQILMNLTMNARDAMPHGGTLIVSTRALVGETPGPTGSEMREGDFTCLRVADTGVGISEENQRHIFEPFFTTKGRGEGTGLGLATVYAIVDGSGGIIEVTSEPGEGTIFEMFFPVTTSNDPIEESARPERGPGGNGECILVAEDEDAVREVVRRILARNGYRVLTARNASEAIALFEGADKVDLLLTDVIMPGLSGKELAEALLRSDPNLPTIMISGYTDDLLDIAEPGTREESILQKPFSAEKLLAVVRSRLAAASISVSPAP